MSGQGQVSGTTRRLLASAGVELGRGAAWDEVSAALHRAGVDVTQRLAVRIELERLGIVRPMGTGGEMRVDPARDSQLAAAAAQHQMNPHEQLSGHARGLLARAGIEAPFTNHSAAAISRRLEEIGIDATERMAVKTEMARAGLLAA